MLYPSFFVALAQEKGAPETAEEPQAKAEPQTKVEASKTLKHSVKFEVRTEFNSDSSKNMPEVYEGDKSSNYFNFQRARFNLQGSLAENLKYRLRFRFDKPVNPETVSVSGTTENGVTTISSSTKKTLDGQGAALDRAYIEYAPIEMLSLTIGKIESNLCAYDGMSGIDAYYIAAPLAVGKCFSSSTMTGMDLVLKPFQGNEFHLIAVNAPEGDAHQATPELGIIYKGNFANGMVKPRLTYHILPFRELKLKETGVKVKEAVNDSVLNIGSDFSYADAELKADYITYTDVDQTPDSNGPGDDVYTSIVGRFSYKISQFRPVLNVESSQYEKSVFKNGSKAKEKKNVLAYGFTLEYNPTSVKNFRFHGGYLSNVSKSDVDGAKEVTLNRIFIGAAAVSEVTILN